MAGTTTLGIPFPEGPDLPLVAQDMQALAGAVNGLFIARKPLAPTSDSGFPLALVHPTGAGAVGGVVADRVTIAPATFARRILTSGHIWGSYSQVNIWDATLYVNDSIRGRARVTPTAVDQQQSASPVGLTFALAADTSAVCELRIERVGGSGVLSTSISGGLTRLQVLVVPA